LCDLVRCLIVSNISNEYADSYLLSESSLFVYPYKVMMKTCGTTTLLKCLSKMEEYAKARGTEIEYAMFSRKNYNFPHRQKVPHCSFEMEIKTLEKQFGEEGQSYVFGPRIEGYDEEYVYVYKKDKEETKNNRSVVESRGSFEMMMSQLDETVMQKFHRNEHFVDAKTTTKEVGLADIIPELETDEVMFDPCGYSVNGLSRNEGSYFTVHITPESHCSFVSFETNSSVAFEEDKLLKRVVEIFKPGKFTMVYSVENMKEVKKKAVVKLEGYETLYKYAGEVNGGNNMIVCHFKKI